MLRIGVAREKQVEHMALVALRAAGSGGDCRAQRRVSATFEFALGSFQQALTVGPVAQAALAASAASPRGSTAFPRRDASRSHGGEGAAVRPRRRAPSRQLFSASPFPEPRSPHALGAGWIIGGLVLFVTLLLAVEIRGRRRNRFLS
jgi:hypothetical protein